MGQNKKVVKLRTSILHRLSMVGKHLRIDIEDDGIGDPITIERHF